MVNLNLGPNQIDYSHARWVPIINCVVKQGGDILLVRRSRQLKHFPGLWNGISGFLDDHRDMREKAEEELEEETGIKPSQIIEIKPGSVFDYESEHYKKIWITHPILVMVNTSTVMLNWEADDSCWVKPREALSFELVPGFDRVLTTLWPWLEP